MRNGRAGVVVLIAGGLSGLGLPVIGVIILVRVGIGGVASTSIGASASHGGGRFSEFTGRWDLVTSKAAVAAPAAPAAAVVQRVVVAPIAVVHSRRVNARLRLAMRSVLVKVQLQLQLQLPSRALYVIGVVLRQTTVSIQVIAVKRTLRLYHFKLLSMLSSCPECSNPAILANLVNSTV